MILTIKLYTQAKTNCSKYNSLFIKKNWFGVKQPTKVDMPLNKETRQNQSDQQSRIP